MPSLRSRKSQPKPRRGDAVWTTSHGNGVVVHVDYFDREAHCRFQEKEEEQISFDDIYGKWTDKFGGMWYLEDF